MRGFLRLFVTSVRVGKVFKFRERTQKSLLMRCEPTENCTGKINQRGGTRANPAAEGAGPARPGVTVYKPRDGPFYMLRHPGLIPH